MRAILGVGLLASLVACGGDDGQPPPDAINVPATITVTGTATKRQGLATGPAAGVLVGAYSNADDSTAAVTAMTDADGNFALVITTGGQALDGHLKATLSGFLDTYLYPPAPLTADLQGGALNMVDTNTLELLSGTMCNSLQDAAKGLVATIVADASSTPVAGATVASSPAASKYCYNAGGVPNRSATMTDTDGVAYMFNVTGQVTVSAIMTGSTFRSHSVKARAGAFTTTIIQP